MIGPRIAYELLLRFFQLRHDFVQGSVRRLKILGTRKLVNGLAQSDRPSMIDLHPIEILGVIGLAAYAVVCTVLLTLLVL